jgi:hypothetical protein
MGRKPLLEVVKDRDAIWPGARRPMRSLLHCSEHGEDAIGNRFRRARAFAHVGLHHREHRFGKLTALGGRDKTLLGTCVAMQPSTLAQQVVAREVLDLTLEHGVGILRHDARIAPVGDRASRA